MLQEGETVGYLGAKAASGVRQAIIAQMPPHDTYIETHLGTGLVMRTKPPAIRTIGIDVDAEVLAAFAPLAPADAELYNADCVDFLDGVDFRGRGRVLVYADPPYVLATRTSHHRYRRDYDDADHRRLVACLRRLAGLGVMVMVSGYPSELYDELLGDWRSIEFQATTRGGPRTEKLWMSYELEAAHWATYAGANFTERQRIKRKAARWRENYRRLSPGERLAVLAAILDEHGG